MVDLLSWQPVPKAEDRRVVINPHAKEAHVKSIVSLVDKKGN